jgi:hypothetical protein
LVSNINRKDLLMSYNRLRLLGGAVAAAVAILASAGAASAHVEINPGTATQGGEASFAFQVPNEQEKATVACSGSLIWSQRLQNRWASAMCSTDVPKTTPTSRCGGTRGASARLQGSVEPVPWLPSVGT